MSLAVDPPASAGGGPSASGSVVKGSRFFGCSGKRLRRVLAQNIHSSDTLRIPGKRLCALGENETGSKDILGMQMPLFLSPKLCIWVRSLHVVLGTP